MRAARRHRFISKTGYILSTGNKTLFRQHCRAIGGFQYRKAQFTAHVGAARFYHMLCLSLVIDVPYAALSPQNSARTLHLLCQQSSKIQTFPVPSAAGHRRVALETGSLYPGRCRVAVNRQQQLRRLLVCVFSPLRRFSGSGIGFPCIQGDVVGSFSSSAVNAAAVAAVI